MKSLLHVNTFFLIVILSILSIQAFSQFEANMHFTLSGNERDFKVFSDVNHYRYEFNADGQEGVVIALKETNQVFVLMPQQKIAINTSPTSLMSMGNDPVKLYEYQLGEGATEKVTGNEAINGYDCIKKELYSDSNQLLYTMWYSDEYTFPIKIVSHMDVAGTTSMELKDIKPWTPDEASFIIPEGYTIVEQ